MTVNSPASMATRPLFGVLNIHKPQGLTSHDVVDRLRKLFSFKKIGHLGTLDPMATGVLPVCFGQATRLIEYFPSDKQYTAQITLGKTTDTLDAEGEVQESRDTSGVTQEAIDQALEKFRGTYDQEVPLYSAVHHQGKKLYEIARGGNEADTEAVELPYRRVTISRLDQLLVDGLGNDGINTPNPVLMVQVACSSGTYIRSLARDIGEALGCGAHLSGLIRTHHGSFTLRDAMTLEALETELKKAENAGKSPHCLLNEPVAYLSIPTLPLKLPDHARRLANGMQIPYNPSELCGPELSGRHLCLVTWKENVLGVAQARENQLKPVKIFQGNS
ncbi:MAG: tRNA pseudouridine(55) synthase TruB [Vampirovibrionales bacterium]|nr:tRNA pseudouridine(55) synthase TruB [Vampirovibrionales bacterium]